MKKNTSLSKSLIGLGLFLGSTLTISAQSDIASVSPRLDRGTTTKLSSYHASYDRHNKMAINQIRNHIITHVLYPDNATNYDVEGEMVIEISMDDHGKITNTHIVKSLSPSFDRAVAKEIATLQGIELHGEKYYGEHTVQLPIRFTNAY